MSRRPVSSARRAATIASRSSNVWPMTSRPQPRSRTTSAPMPRTWWAEGRRSEKPVRVGVVASPRRRWPAMRPGARPGTRPAARAAGSAGPGVPSVRVMEPPSDPVALQPELQQPQLPELVAPERRQPAVRIAQQALDVVAAEQPALPGRVPGQGVADQVEHLALEVGDRRDEEVALGPVDHLGRDDPPADGLEHPLAAVGELELGRAGRRELDE